MKHIKSFQMIQETKTEIPELNHEQLVLVMKNQYKLVIGALYNFQHGDDNIYKKGDVLMYIGNYNSTNWENYYQFMVTRGHGEGEYSSNSPQSFTVKEFWKKIDKGDFKLIDDIREREKLLHIKDIELKY
ncbi:MAG: hypothetical protein ACC656_05510 [Candidatus Heimdallarchaeota archaeon]